MYIIVMNYGLYLLVILQCKIKDASITADIEYRG